MPASPPPPFPPSPPPRSPPPHRTAQIPTPPFASSARSPAPAGPTSPTTRSSSSAPSTPPSPRRSPPPPSSPRSPRAASSTRSPRGSPSPPPTPSSPTPSTSTPPAASPPRRSRSSAASPTCPSSPGTPPSTLAGNGDHLAALDLFREMQRDTGLAPDAYTVQSVLGACTGALSLGVYAHAMLLRELGGDGDGAAVSRDVLINNSLVDLYGKCGAVELARQVFDRMPARDLASWNVMTLTLANHGCVRESVEMFDRMTRVEKVVPNAITFVAVLSACNHGGLVEEGWRYFEMMVGEYGIKPRIEHYGCMVDILARAGFIEEALDVVSGMSCRPDAIIWRSLLDACCKKNAGLELSEAMAKLALDVPDDAVSGVYVLLSRVYASVQRWNDAGMVRRLMSEEGVKEPGFSSIEMDGLVHQFVAGDTSHPQSEEIYQKLDEIEQRLTSAGYKPDLSEAPIVAGVDLTKGAALRLHSERLAISFGLLNATPGAPIRILKNLSVCKDCHTISKLVSKMYDVETIVRDRIRFHHFKDGSCSCKGYWWSGAIVCEL